MVGDVGFLPCHDDKPPRFENAQTTVSSFATTQGCEWCSGDNRGPKGVLGGIWASWLALVGIILVMMARSDSGCHFDTRATNAFWRSDGAEAEQCKELDLDLSPYDTGALLSMEAVYWLQLLDIEGDGPRHRELQHATPLAVGTTITCIIMGQQATNAILVVLPLSMSLATTVSRLCDQWILRRRRQWRCMSCRLIREGASNGELGMAYSREAR